MLHADSHFSGFIVVAGQCVSEYCCLVGGFKAQTFYFWFTVTKTARLRFVFGIYAQSNALHFYVA